MARSENPFAKRIQKRKEKGESKRAYDVILSEDERNFADLPFEITSEILARLAIEDLLRSKSVCKTWYNVTKDPHFIHLQMETALTQPHRIIIAYSDCSADILNSLLLVDTNNWTKIPLKNDFKLTRRHRIVGSCNGLLCIASSFIWEPVYIYNPITGEYTELPIQGHKYLDNITGVIYGFGFDQIRKKYKVIRVYQPQYYYRYFLDGYVTEDTPSTLGEIITVGEYSWREVKFPCGVEFRYGSKIVFLDEAFHWKIDRYDRTSDSNGPNPDSENQSSGSKLILAFHISNEKFHTLRFPHVVDKLPDTLSLINLDESLAFVEPVAFDSSTKIWEVVGSGINDKLLRPYTFNFVSEKNGLPFFRSLVGKLSNGTFLYKVTDHHLQGIKYQRVRDGICQKILPMVDPSLYNVEEEQYFTFKMQGTTNDFDTVLYVPTFSSPIYFSNKPRERKERSRGRERNDCMSHGVSLSLNTKEQAASWKRGRECRRDIKETGGIENKVDRPNANKTEKLIDCLTSLKKVRQVDYS